MGACLPWPALRSQVFNFIFIIVSTDSFGTYAPTLSLPTHNGPSSGTKDDAAAAAPVVGVAAGASASAPSAPAAAVPSGTPTYSPASSPLPAAQGPVVTEPAEQYPSYAAAGAGQAR